MFIGSNLMIADPLNQKYFWIQAQILFGFHHENIEKCQN